jgi:hypothetical protein
VECGELRRGASEDRGSPRRLTEIDHLSDVVGAFHVALWRSARTPPAGGHAAARLPHTAPEQPGRPRTGSAGELTPVSPPKCPQALWPRGAARVAAAGCIAASPRTPTLGQESAEASKARSCPSDAWAPRRSRITSATSRWIQYVCPSRPRRISEYRASSARPRRLPDECRRMKRESAARCSSASKAPQNGESG